MPTALPRELQCNPKEAATVTDFSISDGPNWMGENPMEYVCRYCGKRKGDTKGWQLGFEGTGGEKVMKYTITLLGKWDEQRASEVNAVHFCSTACQDKYLSKNYGDESWAV